MNGGPRKFEAVSGRNSALWTPGYWGWRNGFYAWHGGYWGTHIGFYGGVNYGFGYVGHGYEGGYWNGGVFSYNRSVNNVNTTIVHNVYNKTFVENDTRVSFTGGQGGIAAQPTSEERLARAEPHAPPTGPQHQHELQALRSPEQRASFNHGAPVHLAMAHPAGASHGVGHPGDQMHAELGSGRPMPDGGRELHGQQGPQTHAGAYHGGGPAKAIRRVAEDGRVKMRPGDDATCSPAS